MNSFDKNFSSVIETELFNYLLNFRQEQGYSHKSSTKYAKYMLDLDRGRAIVSKLTSTYVSNSKVLDVGCGYGTLLKAFQEAGFEVSGLDIDQERVQWTSQRLNIKDIFCASATKLPWQDSIFDIVTSTDVLEHLNFSDQIHALTEMIRVTKSNGLIHIEVPNKYQLIDEHNHIPFGCWMPSSLRNFFSRLITNHFVQCWERSKSSWYSIMLFDNIIVSVVEKFPRNMSWLRFFHVPPNRFYFTIRKV